MAVIACDDGLTPTEPTFESGGPLASKAEPGLASGGKGSIGVCNADALGAALASASPGDVVTIGACRVSGSFTVPEGVTLRGRSGWLSVIEAPAAGDGVVLETGRGTTVLERVRIHSEGGAAVRVHAGGAAAVRHAIVRVERGLGIAATGVATLSIERVALGGMVTRSTASTLPPLLSPDATSTHGLFLRDVEHLSIDGVTIGGFGRVGALVAHSESKWDDVHVIGNAEVGLAVVGGTAELEDGVRHTWAAGLPPDEPPAAVALVAGARARTHDLALDIPEIRPALLPTELRDHLDVLRRFRHRVRHAYGEDLAWHRMAEPLEARAKVEDLMPAFMARCDEEIGAIVLALETQSG